MLNHPTLEKLRSLRLTGMADAFQEQLEKPLPDLDFESRLGLLIGERVAARKQKIEKTINPSKITANCLC